MGLRKEEAQMRQPRAFWTATPSQDLGSFSRPVSPLGAGDKAMSAETLLHKAACGSGQYLVVS